MATDGITSTNSSELNLVFMSSGRTILQNRSAVSKIKEPLRIALVSIGSVDRSIRFTGVDYDGFRR